MTENNGTKSRFPSLTHARIELSNQVSVHLRGSSYHPGILLIRHTVDFITGSDMITVARFESAATAKLSEIERQQALAVADTADAIIFAEQGTEDEYPPDFIRPERMKKLLDIVEKLDAQFDVEECKLRIHRRLNDGYPVIRIDELARQDVDAIVAFLTGTETEATQWFFGVLDRIEASGEPATPSAAEQYWTALDVMLDSYPSVVHEDRSRRLTRAAGPDPRKPSFQGMIIQVPVGTT